MTLDDELPMISIITPTYNRRNTFRLALLNFATFDYPRNKLEWIIIDDGTDPIRDLLPTDERIKYFYYGVTAKKALWEDLKKKMTGGRNKRKSLHLRHKDGFADGRIPLGMKRNIACSKAIGEYIVHMDDDDYYYPEGIRKRIVGDCSGIVIMQTFDVDDYISAIARQHADSSNYMHYYDCSLAYRRSFWEKHKFDNQDIKNVSRQFLKGRSGAITELRDKDIVVKLYHNKNKLRGEKRESNGWHFGEVPENIFILMTSFDSC